MFQKNQRVRFNRKPKDPQFESHYSLALDYLDKGKIYTVEHWFAGEPAQIEVKGIDTMLFSADMFEEIE